MTISGGSPRRAENLARRARGNPVLREESRRRRVCVQRPNPVLASRTKSVRARFDVCRFRRLRSRDAVTRAAPCDFPPRRWRRSTQWTADDFPRRARNQARCPSPRRVERRCSTMQAEPPEPPRVEGAGGLLAPRNRCVTSVAAFSPCFFASSPRWRRHSSSSRRRTQGRPPR